MLLGLETFSYLPWFMAGRMDVFDFIRRTHELGLDGVQLNIGVAADNWGALAGADPERLHAVRALCEELGLFVEVDTRTYDRDTLVEALRISEALDADTLRTYVSIPDDLHGDALHAYMQPGGGLARDLEAALPIIRSILPLCERAGIRLAIENHEYETSAQVVEFVRALDSEWAGILIDTGNMMTVWEDPVAAVANMAPWAVSTHFKDHAVMIEGDEPVVVGVPLGRGSIDLQVCYRLLANGHHSPASASRWCMATKPDSACRKCAAKVAGSGTARFASCPRRMIRRSSRHTTIIRIPRTCRRTPASNSCAGWMTPSSRASPA